MTTERDVVLAKLTEALAYLPLLRERIDAWEATSRGIEVGLGHGSTIAECLESQRSAKRRRETTDAFGEFERLRHDARLAMINLAVSEGMSKSDIARAWGISRQWAGKEVDAATRRHGPHASS